MNTGELIRKYRKEKNLTMKKLGELVGVSEQAISQYERGLRNANLEMLIKLSNALDIDVNNLLEENSTISQEVLENISSKTKLHSTEKPYEDKDIYIIQRAKSKMPKNEQDKMMKILKMAFEDYFNDED